jgi:hypothetical protein
VAAAREVNVFQLGHLAPIVEAIIIGDAMQHGRYPPGEILRSPRAAQTGLGVGAKRLTTAGLVERSEGPRQHAHIGDGEIHSRWAEQCAPSRARNRLPYCIGSATKVRMQAQLVPDPLIGPEAELLIRRALQIEPRDRRRANAEERESALVVRVDQFFGRGRRFGQDSQPGERINANHHSR